MDGKVYIVDGSSYIFRAFYAIRPLSTASGFPTNALLGFTRMLVKLLDAAGSEHVIMVFDAGRETFRNEIYPEYKANRDECPEDLVPQMPVFREISTALGLQVIQLPGYEADDVIGTLVRRYQSAGVESVIVTGDKDLMQLVNDQTTIWDTMKDRKFGPKEVVEKMGVPPEKIVDFLALTGDSSDNIPGLRGVGPKTAVQLIERYQDVEGVLNSSAEILQDKSIRSRKKISEQIELDQEVVRLSKRLTQIEENAPVPVKHGEEIVQVQNLDDQQLYEAALRSAPDRETLTELFERLEFDSLIREFNLNAGPAPTHDCQYQTIFAPDFASFVDTFLSVKEFAFDLETTSLDPHQAEIVGVALCWNEEQAYYIPLAHKETDKKQVTLAEFVEACGDHFKSHEVKKAGQNLKYDVSVFAANGLDVQGVAFDSMIASYLLNPERNSHSLKALSKEFLGFRTTEYQDVVGDLEDFSYVPVAEATAYAAEDAHFAWLLKDRLTTELKEFELEEIFNKIEMPLVKVLSDVELRGIELDVDFLRSMSDEFASELEGLTTEIHKEAGREFNINSPKQLSEVLFDHLGIPTKGLKKTKTGISTNVTVLEQIQEYHPVPALVLRYRLLHKLKSTYVDALPEQVSEKTKRLHTRLNQTGTATGRLSSSEPNLQNIPIQTEEGRRVRKAFVAPEGKVLVSADYSQVELRVLAHLSSDEALIDTFARGVDIHARTTREILGIPEDEEITSEQRRIGKTINFGVVYGMSGFRLGRELEIPVQVASGYIEDYFNSFPRVKEYFGKLEHQAEEKGYVETLFGRKRFIDQIDSSGRDARFVLRAAINAPIQGTAADLIKLAMINLERRSKERGLPLSMILQIHDELLFEVEKEALDECLEFIRTEMEGVYQLKAPLKVDVGSGRDWQEAHS